MQDPLVLMLYPILSAYMSCSEFKYSEPFGRVHVAKWPIRFAIWAVIRGKFALPRENKCALAGEQNPHPNPSPNGEGLFYTFDYEF